MVLREKQKMLIEKIGVATEKEGMQPAAARIIGLLYVSDKTDLTFEEILQALRVSKSAASNALNLLLQTNRIEYTTFTGDRKRYFRIKVANWREGFTKKMEDMTSFSQLLKEVLHERTPETKEFNRSLEELADFMTFINSQLPGLLDKWEKSREN
ncbi:GbsR/MarR family transcriptional regulator [Adhaeribacter terreus]|uniref:GbsR/MarR family transcriptional regulator n=1 Tax=Adhaeribacter terreus TaxID=529703 RepID=A0ABW0EGS1_9BACT